MISFLKENMIWDGGYPTAVHNYQAFTLDNCEWIYSFIIIIILENHVLID